jgi:flagellar hook-associated protein 2
MASFVGVGSGLPATQLASRKTTANKQITALGDIVSKLKALESKMKSLDSAGELRAVTAKSSHEDRVKVTASGAAIPGTHRIEVQALARAQVSQSRAFALASTPIGSAGTLTIQAGSEDSVGVTFSATDTIGAVASRINETGAGVHAHVLFNGTDYRLMISSDQTGLENAITFSETNGSLGFLDSDSIVVEAEDARVELDGSIVTRPTNQLSDVLPGLTFDLISQTPVGGVATDVTITTDQGGVKKKVQELIAGYNDVVKLRRTSRRRTARPPARARWSATRRCARCSARWAA